MEGAYVEELAAIRMSVETLQLLDVYHEFAKPKCSDAWARRHVHGLNKNLHEIVNAFETPEALIRDFKDWTRGMNVLTVYANNPMKEQKELDWPIRDIGLPNWEDRDTLPSHEIALGMKKRWLPVLNRRCSAVVHKEFEFFPVYRGRKSELAKARWGCHCPLYECFEMMLEYSVTSMERD